jgi:hypothetical protein
MPDQRVIFQSIEDFIEELKAIGDDGLADRVIRVQVEQQEQNQTLTQYWLRAGYMTADGDLHELVLDCGMSPVRVNSGMTPGDEVSVTLQSNLSERLKEMGLEIRRGAYVA